MNITKTLLCFLLLSASWTLQAKLNVFACEPEWASLAESLGGKQVKTFSATTAFQDPHHIEARPSLIAKVRRADLVVCTGSELEIGWLPVLLRQSGNARVQIDEAGYFMASEGVDRLEIPDVLDRSLGDIHAGGNPHVHLDPYRLLKVAKQLSARLKQLDPANTGSYEQRFTDFATRWEKAITKWELQAANLKGKQAVVYHRNWSYLLEWLGIEAIADLEPKPGLPPTSAHLVKLLKTVRTKQPAFILTASYQDKKGAKWLAGKSNLNVITLPFTVGGNKQAKDLFSLYDDTIQQLIQPTL